MKISWITNPIGSTTLLGLAGQARFSGVHGGPLKDRQEELQSPCDLYGVPAATRGGFKISEDSFQSSTELKRHLVAAVSWFGEFSNENNPAANTVSARVDHCQNVFTKESPRANRNLSPYIDLSAAAQLPFNP